MLTDALLQFSKVQDLTALVAATATASTNMIDLSQLRDLGNVDDLKFFALFPTLPVSATSGATIQVSVQVSTDATNFVTLESMPATTLSSFSAERYFLMRAAPAFSNTLYRYMRLSYTVSAVLTAGTITTGLSVEVPARHAYARNYVA